MCPMIKIHPRPLRTLNNPGWLGAVGREELQQVDSAVISATPTTRTSRECRAARSTLASPKYWRSAPSTDTGIQCRSGGPNSDWMSSEPPSESYAHRVYVVAYNTGHAPVIGAVRELMISTASIVNSKLGGVLDLRARSGHAPSANPLILVIAGDHPRAPKSLFSLGSSGVRDVGIVGSNPVTPTIDSIHYFSSKSLLGVSP
jgi:hypothetical protein